MKERIRDGDLGHEIVRKVLAGDRASFEKLFDELFPRIHAVAQRRTGSARRAEAVAAATLTTAFDKLDQLPEEKSVALWVLAILRDVLAAEQRAPAP